MNSFFFFPVRTVAALLAPLRLLELIVKDEVDGVDLAELVSRNSR
jgi:hypothetical protein